MKYEVTIAETWTKTITVEANSCTEADMKALKQYNEDVGSLEHEGLSHDLDAKRANVSITCVREA